jgi:polar amino acid transport system substrate-binding protein
MGVELKIVEIEFSQLLPALKIGDVDIVMSGMTMTAERNLEAAFIGPYIISGKSMLTTAATLNAMGENVDFNKSNLTLATLGNSTSQKFVEAVMPMATLMIVRDYDEAVQAVLDGKANAMVADFPICALSQMRNPNSGLATLAEPLTLEPIGMALPPGDSLLLNMVENFLSTLTGMGVLETLETRWFDDGSWLSQLP